MSRRTEYRARLRGLDEWEPFLLAECGLPGPRANLELVQAAADEGTLPRFREWLTRQEEYLALCGAVGLGRLIAEGQVELVPALRMVAEDGRWRVREGVAMGLQRLGARDMPMLLHAMQAWSEGSWLEQRAVIAALCEPALVRDPGNARSVLTMLDAITAALIVATDGWRVRTSRRTG